MANQTLVRHINERRLLGTLRVDGPLSRAELARRLSLTRATVTYLVADLSGRRLVVEMPAAAGGGLPREVGRPGIEIALNPAGAYFLGVEIGVGFLRFALLDLAGGVAETQPLPLHHPTSPDRVVTMIERKLADLRQVPAYRDGLRACVVTVPGLVSADGNVLNLPIIGWKNIDLAALIASRIDLPCRVENNANAAAFGHMYSAPRADHGVVVYLKIGNGCGGAVIIDDKLLRGSNGLGTEFGHLRIASDGPLCSCGQRGCLETFVNLRALQRYLTGEDVQETATDPNLPASVAALLQARQPNAENAISTLAHHLAQALVDITNVFNPDEVVIGGPMLPILDAVVAKVTPLLADGIVQGMTMPRLVISRIGTFECAFGAAALAHHGAFDLTNLDLRA